MLVEGISGTHFTPYEHQKLAQQLNIQLTFFSTNHLSGLVTIIKVNKKKIPV
jgi:hypothetical protein